MSAAVLVPLAIAFAALYALCRHTDVYTALTDGIFDGIKTMFEILPAILGLITAVAMLRASGAMDALTVLLSPILSAVGIPPETAPLLLIRPLSGSGALAVGAELIARNGPDSLIGRTVAVMLGSTETTFYTISVYFGAAKIRKTRYAIPAAVIADIVGFITAAACVRMLF